MTRQDDDRLQDVLDSITAIRSHTARGPLSDGLIYDAVRVRLIEIGEAIKSIPTELVATEPTIPWTAIARMRDHLAHRYFDTEHALVTATVEHDLAPLEQAIHRLRGRFAPDE